MYNCVFLSIANIFGRNFIKLLLAKPRFSKRGIRKEVVGRGCGRFKYFKFPLRIGKFPMTPVKGRVGASRITHRIKSPMGWGCGEPAFNSRMKLCREGGWNGRNSTL